MYMFLVRTNVPIWNTTHVVLTVQCYGFVDIVDLQCLKVLFEKLRLHERCENKKLPKTVNKQQQSTSEAAVWHTQIHKHKNTQTCQYNPFNLRKPAQSYLKFQFVH